MMLTVKDVSKLLSITEKTIYRWISRGEIPAYKIGEAYRFNRVELLEWATSRKIAVSPDLFKDDADSVVNPAVSLTEAIRAGGIYYRVPGSDKESVLRSIVDTIHLPAGADKDLLAKALIARENLGTTAIGDGIAIPHVRNPIVIQTDKPVLALCFLEHGVDFDALDKKPVDTVFTIITPNVRSHLSTLSRLSFALYRTDIRKLIDPATRRDDIFAALAVFESTLDSPQNGNRT